MTSRPIRGSGALRRLVSCIALLVGWPCAVHAHAAPTPSLRGRLAVDASGPVSHPAPAAAARAGAVPGSVRVAPNPRIGWRTSLDKVVAVLTRERGQVDAELACVAMAVHREAGGQPLSGQLAVAQVIENRMRSSRFPRTACSVVNQPGQFFSTRGYAVAAGSRRWLTALAVARAARMGVMPQAAPGALFFHAAAVAPPWSRTRLKVARIGDQVFYR